MTVETVSYHKLDIRIMPWGLKLRLAPKRWLRFTYADLNKLARLAREQGWILQFKPKADPWWQLREKLEKAEAERDALKARVADLEFVLEENHIFVEGPASGGRESAEGLATEVQDREAKPVAANPPDSHRKRGKP